MKDVVRGPRRRDVAVTSSSELCRGSPLPPRVRLRRQELIARALEENAAKTGNPQDIRQAQASRAELERLEEAARGWRGPIPLKALTRLEDAVWSGQLDAWSIKLLQHLLPYLRFDWQGDPDRRLKLDVWRCAAVAAELQRRRRSLRPRRAVRAAIAAVFPRRAHVGEFLKSVNTHRKKAMRGELPAGYSFESLAPRELVTAALGELEKLSE